jgi:hypothetical protein
MLNDFEWYEFSGRTGGIGLRQSINDNLPGFRINHTASKFDWRTSFYHLFWSFH